MILGITRPQRGATLEPLLPPTGPAGILLAGIAVGLVTVGVMSAFELDPLLVVSAAQLLVVAVGLFAIRRLDAAFDVFNPANLVLLAFPLMYTLQAYRLLQGQDVLFSGFVPWLRLEREAQVEAALLALCGLLTMLAGYFTIDVVHRSNAARLGSSASTRPLPNRSLYRHRLSGFTMHQRAWLVAGFGTALFTALIIVVGGPVALLDNLFNRTVFFQGLNYLASGSMLVAGAASGRMIADGRWPLARGTVALVVLALALAVLSGTRADIAIDLMLFAAIIHRRYRPIPRRFALPALLGAAVILSGYQLYFRDAIPRGVPLSQVVAERGGVTGALGQLTDGALFGHQAMSIAVVEFPALHDFTHFAGLQAFLLAPIPRSLLPTKPDALAGTFTDTFAPIFHAQGSTVPATALGEMYISFGAPGVLIGGFLFGMGLQWAQRQRYGSDCGFMLAALSTACVLHYLRGEIYGVGVVFLLTLIPALWVLGGRTHTSAVEAGE